MRAIMLTCCLLLAATSTATAETYETKGGYPACLTEELFDEATRALVNRDAAHFQAVKGCIITKAGIRLAVISPGFATSKVRLIMVDGTSVVVFTNRENLQKR